MSLSVECPGCEHLFRVPPSLQGKLIRCKQCGETFRVPAGRASRPIQAALIVDDEDDYEDDDYEDDDEPRSGKTGLILGIVGGVLLLVGAGVGAYLLIDDEKDDDRPVAQAPGQDQQNEGGGGLFGPRPAPNPAPTPDPRPNPNIDLDPTDNPVEVPTNKPWAALVDAPVMPSVPVKLDPPSPVQRDDDLSEAGPWSVEPDPLPEPLTLPAQMRVEVPFPRGTGTALFPTTPSLFFAAGQNRSSNEGRVLWDLSINKQRAVIRGQLPYNARPIEALSPGGGMLAVAKDKAVGIVSFQDNKLITTINGEENVEWVDFGPNEGELLINRKGTIELVHFAADKQPEVIATAAPSGKVWTKAYALSPNRKYLALAADDNLLVYEVAGLKEVGRRSLPNGSECHGLGFSPDGKELTALASYEVKPMGGYRVCSRPVVARLIAWDVATGNITADHRLTETLKKERFDYPWEKKFPGRPIEYVSNNRDWFLFGRYLIEHDSGMGLGEVPYPGSGLGDPPARHVLPNDLLLTVIEVNNKEGVFGIPLEYQARRDTVRQTFARPEVTEADRTTARTVTAPGEVTWSVQPTPTRVPPLRATPLTTKASEVFRVYMGGAESGRALTLSKVFQKEPIQGTMIQAELLDLSDGRGIGSYTLPLLTSQLALDDWEPVADFGPRGETFALRDPADPKRVDVWSTGESLRHLVALRPYGDEADVAWLGLPADGRLITLSSEGELVSWEVPTGKAVYRTEAKYTAPVFDPSRRLLAVFAGPGFDFLDVSTGEVKGRINTGEPAQPKQHPPYALGAFHLNGSRFAAVISGDKTQAVGVWDLSTGERTTDFETNHLGRRSLQWCGDRFLAQDIWHVIDLERQALIWGYQANGNFAQAAHSPDGRLWHIPFASTGVTPTLAPADVAQHLSAAIQEVEAVSVSVNVGQPDFQSEATRLFGEQLRDYGYQIRNDAPVKLEITGGRNDATQKVNLQESFTYPRITGEARLIGPDGQPFWTRPIMGSAPPIKGADDSAQLARAWQQFHKTVFYTSLPRRIAVMGGQGVALPGRSGLPER